jgi:hypothetical protein
MTPVRLATDHFNVLDVEPSFNATEPVRRARDITETKGFISDRGGISQKSISLNQKELA